MKPKASILTALLAILILLLPVLPACSNQVEAASDFVAIIPRVLHAGSQESVSISVFDRGQPVKDRVEISLLDDGREIQQATAEVNGKGAVQLYVPDIQAGEYQLQVRGKDFSQQTSVAVEKSFLAFLETDKPVYKPGQTIHIRTITLNADLIPVTESVTVEVLDARGIKIFRGELTTDEYGLASLDLPLSQEPNLGVWKITAVNQKASAQVDVRVEEYVLPKYEIVADLPAEWFLVDQPVTGTVRAEYSFGKPVSGTLEIRASRYMGKWQQYATFSTAIDGRADFELPAAGYVAGTPASGGLGNVILDITVTENATGYQEKTNRLLTVAENPLNIQLIPESQVFKPGLPFKLLAVTENPANQPLEAELAVTVTYLDGEYAEIQQVEQEVSTTGGKAIIEISPPADAVAMTVECFELTPVSSRPPATASRVVQASYSPSGNFIHVEQSSQGIPVVGEEIHFRVNSTRQATNFYYEVVSRGRVVFTDYTRNDEIAFVVTPQMAPSARLLVYEILPNSEITADFIPFEVEAEYPHEIEIGFDKQQAAPGDQLVLGIQTQGQSKVGIAAVDKSVYILAENRLNLEQVFAELERLYMMPMVELHEVSLYPSITTKGALEIFDDAGVVVLSNNNTPEGREYQWEGQPGFWDRVWNFFGSNGMWEEQAMDGAAPPITFTQAPKAGQEASSELAEVSRIRQYFPETWLWDIVTTATDGQASLEVTVPDSITTWMLRAVALSKEYGLGVAETQLRAFQPFFLSIDLEYSAIRGEEFPIRAAIYNYLDEPQQVQVEIEPAGWFSLLDDPAQTVNIEAGEVGSAVFMVRADGLGLANQVKVTARSTQAADAVIKTVIVAPEGIAREELQNMVLAAGSKHDLDTSIPGEAVTESGRVYLALTSSYLTQTIDGLEGLIQMPFGCGEQNMIVFAPDVYITRYLEESGQIKPEIMAKAEKLMVTGYQRQLTYRRSDGSFSAFGQSDDEGSLWLTAFVLKSFSQAKDIMYIDDTVLREAVEWIEGHQNSDGSFDQVGFVHHQEMLGGVSGRNALTAYVAVALLEAGEGSAAGRAVGYLAGKIDDMQDAYSLAITTYALELAGSQMAGEAYDKLMEMAVEDENGLHWGDLELPPQSVGPAPGMPERFTPAPATTAIEATGYATLALVEHGDAFSASRAAKWLVSQRNAYGGYGSTQDTVVALQALTSFSAQGRADVDLSVIIESGDQATQLEVNQQNYDVLQVLELPAGQDVRVSASGSGEAILQLVKRYNVPEVEEQAEEILVIDVEYDTTSVEVDDLVEVSVRLEFNPPQPMEAGMVVLDVSVPTGFAAVTEMVSAVVDKLDNIKRYELAGRKVIFYVDNMLPGDVVEFNFDVQALYPVKAKSVSSQAYSYYQPEIHAETLGLEMTVS